MQNKSSYRKLMDISRKYGVPMRSVLHLFQVLKFKPVNNTELISTTRMSKTLLSGIKKEFKNYFLPVSQDTFLSDHGKQMVPDEAETIISHDFTEELFTQSSDNFINVVEMIHEQREEPERKYDQFLATKDTVVKRVEMMNFLSDLKDKKILFIGDDDFTSIATAVYEPSAEITVIEIDPRIKSKLEKIAKQLNITINVVLADVKNKLSDDIKDSFDVVFTDPPYTVEGIKLFVSRAIDALDYENKSGRIYFCYGNSDLAKEKFVEIQKVICDLGLMQRYVFDKFNRYTGADSIGNSSNLYICDVSPKTKSLVQGKYNGKLYTID